uniref:Uncharacterized protein n=1 Tax=Nannospalax galili TaxID=1026970 RepID=A0A8C6W4X7_NANGA
MSIPVAPKKSCFSQLQDHRNGAKNNNESILSLGDTNANQIMLEISSSHDEPKTCDLVDEIGNANLSGPEYHSHFQKEPVQGFGRGSQTSKRDFQLSSTDHRELSEEHTVERGPDIPQTPLSVQRPSLSSWKNAVGQAIPEVLTKRDAEIPQHVPKDKLAKTLDNEELKRHSVERASSSVTAPGSLTRQHLQPAWLDTPESWGPVHGGGEGTQGTSAGLSPGAVFTPVDSTSEEKSVHPPKPSTSEAKGSIPSETQMEVAHGLNVYHECTARAAHPEPTPHLVSASKEIFSYLEAHLGQGRREPKLELKYVQPRTEQELKPAQTGDLGCHREESVSPVERKVPHGEAHKETKSQPDSSCQHLGVGRRSSLEEMMGVSIGGEGSLQAEPEQSIGPSGEASSQLTGKMSPNAGRRVEETTSGNFVIGDGHRAFVPSEPMDRTSSRVSGELRSQDSGDTGSAQALASGPSVGEYGTEVAELLDLQSGGSEARQSRETVIPVSEDRNLLENEAKPEITLAGADSVFSTPAPLHPETTVNLIHHPTLPGSGFQELGVFSVNTGSSSVASPSTESGRVLDTSPKVPDKNTSPSGIPKPVTHPKDMPSALEAMEKHEVEKTEERTTETKPVLMPKPKHVRPKIITYIRRNPQALGQGDASLVPVGLPYATPTCGMPLAQEEKAATCELQPSTNLYEKFKPDSQKPRVFPSGLMVSGIKPPGHHFSQMSEKFLQEVRECSCNNICMLV